jgi:transposase
LWTLVRLAGVEPTNNAAERAICPKMLWHKGSHGTRSIRGSRFVEAMMQVVATLHEQHCNLFHYLTTACKAMQQDETVSSLLAADDSACQWAAA